MGSEEQKPCVDEALLEEPAVQAAPGPSLLTIIGFAFLTFNSAMAVYSSNTEMGAISFGVFSIVDLVMLLYCLCMYKGTAPGSPRREHLKMAVWLLTTMLTFGFFTLLEFWFVTTEDVAVKTRTAPHLHHQYLPSMP